MKLPDLKKLRMPVAALALSVAGLAGLATHEGTKQRVYLDTKGVPTVCTGHTGTGLSLGAYYTPEQCAALLVLDSTSASNAVRSGIKVPLYQSEFDALVDFCFNVGSTACKSSSLFKLINNGDYNAAGKQFLRWKFVGDLDCSVPANKCYGIYQRRLDEYALFRSEH